MINKKKIIISTIIVLALLFIFISIFSTYNKSEIIEYTVLKSNDEKIELTVPDNIGFEPFNASDTNFSLNIYSKKNNFFIYSNTIEKQREVDFLNIIRDYRNSFINSHENVANASDVIQININKYSSYEYFIDYYDSEFGDTFYINSIWFETDENIFIINFEIPAKDYEILKPVIDNIKSTIKLY